MTYSSTQRYAVEVSHLADWFGLGRNDYHRGLQRLRPCGLGLERQHVFGDCSPIYFDFGAASSGTVTVRVQVREDGLSIDRFAVTGEVPVDLARCGEVRHQHLPGGTGGAAPPPPPPPDPDPSQRRDVVLHPGVDSTRVGAWTTAADSTAVEGFGLVLPNTGRPKGDDRRYKPGRLRGSHCAGERERPLPSVDSGKAPGNSYASDSVFVQFTDAAIKTTIQSIRLVQRRPQRSTWKTAAAAV